MLGASSFLQDPCRRGCTFGWVHLLIVILEGMNGNDFLAVSESHAGGLVAG